MKQLNNNTFRKNFQSRHWEKLCFLRNTLGKIPGVATDLEDEDNLENEDYLEDEDCLEDEEDLED